MKKVHSLNKEISIDTQNDIDSMIIELAERVEFTCVGNSCGLDDVMYKGTCTADGISLTDFFQNL